MQMLLYQHFTPAVLRRAARRDTVETANTFIGF